MDTEKLLTAGCIALVIILGILIVVFNAVCINNDENNPKEVSNGWGKVKFDNHIYVQYRSMSGYRGGLTHDPDCPCKSKGIREF